MKVIRCTQGDETWHETRCGRVTASRLKDVLSFTKSGEPTAKRNEYMMEVVCELLTGQTARHFVTPEMQRGIETEPLARGAYEVKSGHDVELVGIAIHETIDRFCASPDGVIRPNGLLEIKCPTTFKHVSWMLENRVPDEHGPQCYGQLSVWEMDFDDFFSFDDRLPFRHQQFQARLWRNEQIIAGLEDSVRSFLQEVDDFIGKLDGLNPEIIAAIPQLEHPEELLSADDIDAEFARMERLASEAQPS